MSDITVVGGVVLRAGRPYLEESYGVPAHHEGLVAWPQVEAKLVAAMNYWLSTVQPDGRPHAMPVWSVWHDGALHFGGGRSTRKLKNLADNPNVVMHLESTTDVVIVEGTVLEVTDEDEQHRIDDVYEAKYGMRHGPPVWRVTPSKVFAWTSFPTDVTRWVASPSGVAETA
jgi:hypothetical protein